MLTSAVPVVGVRRPVHHPLDCPADCVLPDILALKVQLVGGAVVHVDLLVNHGGIVEQRPEVAHDKRL